MLAIEFIDQQLVRLFLIKWRSVDTRLFKDSELLILNAGKESFL